MLTLFVVDLSAASRATLVNQLTSLLHPEIGDFHVVPRVTIKPLSPQELKFHGTPDICLIGSELITQDLTEVARVREMLPGAVLWAQTPAQYRGLSNIDQLARMGADDILPQDLASADLLQKVVLLSKRTAIRKTGKLILVDGGKGGVGVTSVAAALGDALYSHGKKVALLDFDFETQDLSRFLQVRPFVNENLRLLFDEQRPITEDFVKQCLSSLLDDEEGFVVMPPVPDSDDLYESQGRLSRTLLAILEIIDAQYDFVIADIGHARGSFARSLYRAADSLLFVINADPATVYASVEKFSRVRNQLSPGAEITMIENGTYAGGLPSRLLRQEFNRVSRCQNDAWIEKAIPFCRLGGRWPGSGNTLFSLGRAGVGNALVSVLMQLGVIDSQAARSGIFGQLSSYRKKLLGRKREKVETELESPARPTVNFQTEQQAALPNFTHASTNKGELSQSDDFSPELLISAARVDV